MSFNITGRPNLEFSNLELSIFGKTNFLKFDNPDLEYPNLDFSIFGKLSHGSCSLNF